MTINQEKYCKTPCKECPFTKKSLPGYLGGFTIEATLESVFSESSFKCHLTREVKDKKECAGRMLFVSKLGKVFRDEQLEKIRKAIQNSTSEETKNNILSYAEFKKHHL